MEPKDVLWPKYPEYIDEAKFTITEKLIFLLVSISLIIFVMVI